MRENFSSLYIFFAYYQERLCNIRWPNSHVFIQTRKGVNATLVKYAPARLTNFVWSRLVRYCEVDLV